MAIRGTVPRAEMKQIAAATYHQVWWPPSDNPVDYEPAWDEHGYLNPETGEYLPTWTRPSTNSTSHHTSSASAPKPTYKAS